eukprot:c36550_g1_i1 orf=232-1341(-)
MTASCCLFVILSNVLLSWLLLFGQGLACSPGQCQLSQPCSSNSDCAAGLYCSSCAAAGDTNLRCTRSHTYNVVDLNKDLPYNRYSWLTTHNSYAIVGEPSHTGIIRETFENQEDSVTDQLQNGVRGLMLDMYDFNSDVWLCHSFGGQCYAFTAFKPALDTLKEIDAFLSANPSEIITIFIEDYVHANKGLTNVFTAAGLMKYWFPVSQMPKGGGDWPRVSDMIAKNQRLVVFTSNSLKESGEGIAYQWKYVVENQYGDGGMRAGSCPNRAESPLLNTKSRSLVLENFFPTNPTETGACLDNSDMLMAMLNVCYAAAGQRWANFLAVDFYKRSRGGGAFKAVDTLNGRLMCGCNDVLACKPGASSGACTP